MLEAIAEQLEVCPRCGDGELCHFDGDEHYCAGVYSICDCGYSTVQPRITYEQWREKAVSILEERREWMSVSEQAEITADKHGEKVVAALIRHTNKVRERVGHPLTTREIFPDGRDMNGIAPKSRASKQAAIRQGENAEREIKRLWSEYVAWCILFPLYTARFEVI